jgi:hypothetical protein
VSMTVVLILLFMDSFHHFGIEARMFQLLLLFSFLSITECYKLFVEKKSKRIYFVALYLAITIYSHYLGIFIAFLVLAISVVYIKQLKEIGLKKILASLLILISLLAPLIITITSRGTDFISNGTWLTVPSGIGIIQELFKMFNTPFNFIFTILLVAGFWFLAQKESFNKKAFRFFLISGFGLFVFMFLFSILIQSVFLERYLFMCIVIALPSLLAFSNLKLKVPKLKFVFPLICLPFVFSLNFVPDINRETNKMLEKVSLLKKSPETAVVYCPGHYNLTIAYHLERSLFSNSVDFNKSMRENAYFAECEAGVLDLSSFTKVVYLDFNAGGNSLLGSFEENYNWVSQDSYLAGFKLTVYE